MVQAPQTPPQTPSRPGSPQAAPAPLPTLEQSFELLKEFKLGTDSTVLIPITLLEGLTDASQQEHVRLAARRTLSAVTRKS